MQMQLLTSIVCLLVAGAAHGFSVCSNDGAAGDAVDHLRISSIDLTPDQPAPGRNLAVTFAGTPDQSIIGGTLTVAVSVFGVTIATENFDLCQTTQCPLAKQTPFTATVDYTIPAAAPAGMSAEAKVTLTDSAGDQLTCLNLDVKIASKSAAAATTASTTVVTMAAPSSALRGTQYSDADDDDEDEESDSRFTQTEVEFMFETWRRQHRRSFADAASYMRRQEVFGENMNLIANHNDHGTPDDASDDPTWRMAMNQFGHLTSAEFKAQYTGGFAGASSEKTLRTTTSTALLSSTLGSTELADSVDWVSRGAVTSVKQQGTCGSCWTFSTAGAMEGAFFLSTGTLRDFSEEQLVDCDTGGDGCKGGLMTQAFDWIKGNGGICSLDAYPYTETGWTDSDAVRETCASGCAVVEGTAVSGYVAVDSTEAALATAVSKQPVSIAIEADQSAFQFYSSGVLTGTCGTNLDHGVLLVGYGTDNGTKYWKVKNSWSDTWGEGGYVRIEKGASQSGGQCGVLLSAAYPELA